MFISKHVVSAKQTGDERLRSKKNVHVVMGKVLLLSTFDHNDRYETNETSLHDQYLTQYLRNSS